MIMKKRRFTPLVIAAVMLSAGAIVSCSNTTTTDEPQEDPLNKVQVGDIEMAYKVSG